MKQPKPKDSAGPSPSPKGSTRVYSYIRFSHPRQKLGDSKRRQLDASKAWAARRGFEFDESLVMEDEGLSGHHGEHRLRGELGRFLQEIDRGNVPEGSWLVVESLDRLSRETVSVALAQFLLILNAGIKIVTLADGEREYTAKSVEQNPTELLISIIIMWRAYEESATKAYRARENWIQMLHRARNGEIISERCPGWLTVVGRETMGTKKIGGSWKKIPSRVKVLKQIYKLRLEGYGYTRIAQILNSANPTIPTWNNAKNGWADSTIKHLLTDRAVLGDFVPDCVPAGIDADPIPGYYPSVIDEGTFDRVQGINRVLSRTGDRRGGERRDEITNLFPGLLVCGHCDGPMHISRNKKTIGKNTYEYRLLACDSARRGYRCHNTGTFRYDFLEEIILVALADDMVVSDLRKDRPDQSKLEALEEEITQLRQEIEGVQFRRDAFNKRFGDCADNPNLLRRISQSIDSAEAQIGVLSARLAVLETARDEEFIAQQAYDVAVKNMRLLINEMKSAKDQIQLLTLRQRLVSRIAMIVERIVLVSRKRRGKNQARSRYPRYVVLQMRRGQDYIIYEIAEHPGIRDRLYHPGGTEEEPRRLPKPKLKGLRQFPARKFFADEL